MNGQWHVLVSLGLLVLSCFHVHQKTQTALQANALETRVIPFLFFFLDKHFVAVHISRASVESLTDLFCESPQLALSSILVRSVDETQDNPCLVIVMV